MHYKKTKLTNGLRVILAPMKNTETATVIVMIGVGSRYEKSKQAGLSHFIEHMFFKGTKKRPNTLDITTELDAIGGEYNAFTGKDKTGYYAKVDAKHIHIALDVVSDIYLHSKIDTAEIEKEKGTIIQEINMYEDTPVQSIGDLFEKLLFGGNNLGREVAGYKETVAALERRDFIDYMQRFYVANDTVVCIAGKFDEKNILKDIKKYFSEMPKGKKPVFEKVKKLQSQPKMLLKNKKTEQTHLILGARAYDRDHKDRFALGLLAVILGGNMSSRLFIEVREKRGLAYRVATGTEAYADGGYLATQAGVEHNNLEKTVEVILAEYRKIAKYKVSEKELRKAKDFVKGRSIMGFESSDEVAIFFVDQELLRKKIMTLSEIFKKIDKVTPEDILRVAKNIFQNNKLNLAVIGPRKDSQKLKQLLKF